MLQTTKLCCLAATILATSVLLGCGGGTPPAPTGISPQKFADAVHSVMMADRTVYATHVVTRLKKQEAPVKPSEYWQDEDHTIPLPAQMFRMGSELVNDKDAGFTYALKSKWPLNKQNRAKTDLEVKGIEAFNRDTGQALLRNRRDRRQEVLHRILCRPCGRRSMLGLPQRPHEQGRRLPRIQERRRHGSGYRTRSR